MNENVTIKTPKRRRWIARLLVSALCILLASSLLFVSVVAENVNSFTYASSEYIDAENVSYYLGRYFRSNGSMSYCIGKREGGFVRVTRYDVNTLTAISYYDMEVLSSDTVYAVGCSDSFCWCLYSSGSGSSFTVYLEVYSYSVGYYDSVYITGGNITLDDPYKSILYFSDNGHVVFLRYSEDGSAKYLFCEPNGNHFYSKWATLVYGDNTWNVVFLGVDTHAFSLKEYGFYSNTQGTSTGYSNYAYSGYRSFARGVTSGTWREFTISNGVLSYNANVFSVPTSPYFGLNFFRDDFISSSHFSESRVGICWGKDKNISCILATSSEYVPPESSDETTTEPPPESSEGSSTDPSGGTKIWGSILNADGSYTSSLLGTLDLSQATEVRAYIGSWTSKDSTFQSETPVPLTFYVYNSEDGPPDIYTFDYHAAGYSLLGDSVSDFTFPDVIGQFFTLPYNGETDLYFPNVAPYGTVLVSTPFGDSFGGRVMLNLVSVDSYFRLDFVDEDTFAVVVFNTAGPGSRTNFDLDIRAYREGYRLEDGKTSSSRWFYPSFGSSASYTAEYVTESGLYLVFVDSVDDTVYPWEDGTWSDVIGDANSRIEDISTNHALLESLANDAYGKYSFDPMTNQNFIGAVSEFNDIRDSSGGNYILRYMWGMWNIHPFASSMIAIVGTLAIVGFIIRKM